MSLATLARHGGGQTRPQRPRLAASHSTLHPSSPARVQLPDLGLAVINKKGAICSENAS